MSAEARIGRIVENPFKRDDKVLVSKVAADGKNLKESALKAVDLLGGFGKVVEKGDEILLKPNFNTVILRPVRVIQNLLRLLLNCCISMAHRK